MFGRKEASVLLKTTPEQSVLPPRLTLAPPPDDAVPSTEPLPGTPATIVNVQIPAPGTPPSPPNNRPNTKTRFIALVNQKGGVGKTTTTVNLGTALAMTGKRVLLIDLDPQGHLTLHTGIDADSLDKSIYDLLTDPAVTAADLAHTPRENLTVLPAEVNLAGVESELAGLAETGQAQRILRDKCAPLLTQNDGFDYVLIDCPPSLGMLTVNALTLAREVIVPMQAHFLALQGLSKLLETVTLVKQSVNPDLIVAGIILCMHESQTLLAGEVLADLNAFLDAARDQDVPWRDAVVFQPPIRRNIKLAECPSFGQTIFDYAPTCPGANDYQSLAQAVAHQSAAKT